MRLELGQGKSALVVKWAHNLEVKKKRLQNTEFYFESKISPNAGTEYPVQYGEQANKTIILVPIIIHGNDASLLEKRENKGRSNKQKKEMTLVAGVSLKEKSCFGIIFTTDL